MADSAAVSAIGAMAHALGREEDRHTFVRELAQVVTALGTIPDSPAVDFTVRDRDRLRTIADEVVEAVERRIDGGRDNETVKQQLASTIYEVRRRMEVIEGWFTHAFPGI